MKGTVFILSSVGWTSLGFYRGLNRYDYFYAKSKSSSKNNDAPYLYCNRIVDGFLGGFLYINPFFSFLQFQKKSIDLK